MMYRGVTYGLYSNAPADRLYRADFDFLVHPWVWNLSLQTTRYEKVALDMDVQDTSGNIIGARTFSSRKKVANAATDGIDLYYRKSYDFENLLGPIIVT
jgi:hypothetical protein